ncbi:hypothetical protein [Aliamphritea spongicola]|nr:hypothetical protein [Aliamphritea spongicola]
MSWRQKAQHLPKNATGIFISLSEDESETLHALITKVVQARMS